METLGFVESHFLPCVFHYWARDASGKAVFLSGILAVHVDDLITVGNREFEKVLANLKGQLTFGKWYQREFDYTGKHIKQLDDYSIKFGQPHYSDRIPLVPISKEQVQHDTQLITDQTLGDLRRTAGSTCYLSKRADLTYPSR